jgi:hypothetical protein
MLLLLLLTAHQVTRMMEAALLLLLLPGVLLKGRMKRKGCQQQVRADGSCT